MPIHLQPQKTPLLFVRRQQFNFQSQKVKLFLFTAYAKEKHLTLFEKIAAEHVRLGEEQLAQRLAFEATSIRNDEETYQ